MSEKYGLPALLLEDALAFIKRGLLTIGGTSRRNHYLMHLARLYSYEKSLLAKSNLR